MIFRKIFDGCYHGFVASSINPAVVIEQNYFGRKLWSAECNGTQILDNSGNNCFTLSIAKHLSRKFFSMSKNVKIQVQFLSELKKFLAVNGAAVTMLKNDNFHPDFNMGLLKITRRVDKLQTNGVRFVGGSWLYFDRGPAAYNFRFYGNDRFSVDLNSDGKFERTIEYFLSFE